MRRAIELAARGVGAVEPNPPVGAVLVDDGLRVLGEGYHERFGGPHAEVHALRRAGPRAAGATLFVTLEPCCHFGKTPPCTRAVIEAGVRRVVVALRDPAPHVNGGGIAALRAAGLEVDVGLLADEALGVTAPFLKLTTTGLPWVHAKWAMTLDGKIATRTGASRWISSSASRSVVHALRGRMDAIAVGRGTALADDPLLTARPPGPRCATRIVLDSRARLPLDSQLVRTAGDVPVLAAVADAPEGNVRRLEEAGVEVLRLPPGEPAPSSPGAASSRGVSPRALLEELGRRRMTNVLVEGGGALLGGLFDASLLDEAHVFIAPKLAGGAAAPAPLGGRGVDEMSAALSLERVAVRTLDGDVYVRGWLPPQRWMSSWATPS